MITEEMIQLYEQDGAVCIRNAIDGEDAAALLSHLDALIATEGDRWTTNRLGGFSDRHLWPRMPWMNDFCTQSRLPEIAATLMRSSYARLFFDHTFIREAGTTHTTPWHQDRPYWPFQGKQIASVWVALDGCDLASSALRFIKGSHRWGKVFRPEGFGATSASAGFIGEGSEYEEIPDFDADPEKYEVLEWNMQPGDAIVFGAESVHGAQANNHASQRRAAISIRYVGDDARWDPRPGTDPIVTQEMVSIKPGDPPADDKWFPEVWRA